MSDTEPFNQHDHSHGALEIVEATKNKENHESHLDLGDDDDDDNDLHEEEEPQQPSPGQILKQLVFVDNPIDDETRRQEYIVANTKPTTELEIALAGVLERKNALIERITGEITKLKSFVQKRKQTYKRKRKDDGAPIRPMSAYNLFIKERFEQLSKENEKALKSDDAGAELKRVPPSSLVAKTGNEWKELTADIKLQYEERAKADRKRYEEQMAEYQPSDRLSNRKRSKTGYNMFFSAHVIRLKQTENGVPAERGSVARLVGNAWKALTADERQYFEREADKYNGTAPHQQIPVHVHHHLKDGEEDEEEEDVVKIPHHHMGHPYVYPPPPHGIVPPEMHHHHMGLPQHAAAPTHHDPRVAAHHMYAQNPYAAHVYAQTPYANYDYSQHHQRHPGAGGRQQMYQYAPQEGRYDQQPTL